MNAAFYIVGAVAVVAALLAITRLNAVHALLYLIVSLLAVAVVFFIIGAPFIAALEVIIYAGAIMVLFVFAIIILGLGPTATPQERQWLRPAAWIGPALLSLILLVEIAVVLFGSGEREALSEVVEPRAVGALLFGPYLVGVELAALVLLSCLVGAYHLGRRRLPDEPADSLSSNQEESHGSRSR